MRITDPRQLKHGDRVRCVIGSTRIENARVTKSGKWGDAFICQDSCVGMECEEKWGYKYSWRWYGGIGDVTDVERIDDPPAAIPAPPSSKYKACATHVEIFKDNKPAGSLQLFLPSIKDPELSVSFSKQDYTLADLDTLEFAITAAREMLANYPKGGQA